METSQNSLHVPLKLMAFYCSCAPSSGLDRQCNSKIKMLIWHTSVIEILHTE